MAPRITFGLPVFNGERYVQDALDSVLAQDEDSWELVVSDNGSTDGTEEICRKAADRDPRVRYLRQPENHGGPWNFQHVLDVARAPYFSWLCADDRKEPEFASRCLRVLEAAGGDVVMAYPRTRLIDSDGAPIGSIRDDELHLDGPAAPDRVRRLLRAQASPIFYGVMRTDAARATRGVRACVATDIVFLTELACLGPLVLVDVTGMEFRIHDGQASRQGARQMSFYRPAGTPRLAFQHVRANAEVLGGVTRSALPGAQKAEAWLAVWSGWIVPRWRALAHDVLVAVGREEPS